MFRRSAEMTSNLSSTCILFAVVFGRLAVLAFVAVHAARLHALAAVPAVNLDK